jgi:hypothetical protein
MTDDDPAGIQTHAEAKVDAQALLDLLGVSGQGALHFQSGTDGPAGRILVGDGCAENGQDAIAPELGYSPLVQVDGLHHVSQGLLSQVVKFFRVQQLSQGCRTNGVDEQDGYRSTLAADGLPISQDLFG